MDAGDLVDEVEGPLRVGSRPPEFDGVVEQAEPAVEVGGGERVALVDLEVGPKRVALVTGPAQKGAAPERRQFGKMLRPGDTGHVIEKVAE